MSDQPTNKDGDPGTRNPSIRMGDREILIAIGNQMTKIVCPVCRNEGGIVASQTLNGLGDYEWFVVCPHCGLMIELVMRHNPDQ
jgi:hypothetical protein